MKRLKETFGKNVEKPELIKEVKIDDTESQRQQEQVSIGLMDEVSMDEAQIEFHADDIKIGSAAILDIPSTKLSHR